MFTRQGGGAAATALATLASLGIESSLVSAVGDDVDGYGLLDQLKRRGVDCGHVEVLAGTETPRSFIIVNSTTGEASVFTWRPPAYERPLSCDPADVLGGASILHIDGYFQSTAVKLAEAAKDKAIPVSVDAGRARVGFDAILMLADILIVSRTFAFEHASADNPEEALSILRDKYPARVIGITLQNHGSVCWSENDGVVLSPALEIDVLDDSSAGDVFHGAFLYGLLRSWSLEKTSEFANALAAHSCRFFGGRQGIVDSEERVLEFARKYRSKK